MAQETEEASENSDDVQETGEQLSDDVIVLDKIFIFGEKFPRDAFNTFTSVEYVTAEELDDYVVQNLDQALNRSPNVRLTEGNGNTYISIRGLSAEGPTQPSRSSPVISVIVDGAEQSIEATRRGTRGVWDVEQIEVLRGPQSTLQGRNALAGSVVIKTKDPTFTPEMILREEVGTDGLYSGAFAVSTPLLEDQLAVRLTGQVVRDDNGISYGDPSYEQLGDDEFEEFRGKLLLTPSELPGFTGLFTVSYTHDTPASNLVDGPDFFERNYVSSGSTEFRDTVVNRYIADLNYEFNPDWAVQSVTSFVDTTVDFSSAEDQLYFRDGNKNSRDLSQDIRLTYGDADSALSGLVGVYAGKFSNRGNSYIEQEIASLAPGIALPFQILDYENKSTSFAVYGDARYEFIDRWTLLAGARLLHDEISADYEGVVLPGTFVEATLDEESEVSNTEFLPKIGLAFELSENQNVAVTASKGYRPGFSEIIVGTTDISSVEPETMWAYELAYRSRWLDDRLQINGNAFYYDYTNMQVPVAVPGALGAVYTYSINAGQAHSYGAELEARLNLDSGLQVIAGLGLLETRFDAGEFNGSSIVGNKFPNAPALTASLGATYRHASGWFVGGDVSFTDGYYSRGEVQNRAFGEVDSFTLVNAQAGYETDHLSFTVYAKNLLDEEYLTGIYSNGSTAEVGDARSFGLRFTQQF